MATGRAGEYGYREGRWVWLQGAIAGQPVAGLVGQGYREASWAEL